MLPLDCVKVHGMGKKSITLNINEIAKNCG